MRLYDTARGEVVPFDPGPIVTMYTCGITPYDATHLGHAAVYLTYDVLQRRLRDRGHETRCVRNVTDVDDDILRKARELGVHYLDLAAAEMARFDDDMRALDMLPAWSEPRATSAIADIRGLHRHGARPGLRLPGRAAPSTSTSSRFDRFGQVSHLDRDEMLRLAAERGGNLDDPNKRDPLDFVLWQPSRRRRAVVGVAVGPGPAGLAHRVLGAGPARARHHHRPPRRRRRPDLPPPRVRGGPVRGGHRRAVRAPLDAPGDGADGRREDVEVARQPGVRVGAAQGVGHPGDPPGRARPPLPPLVGVERRRHAARRRPAGPLGGGRGRRCDGRRRPSTRCGPRSTTTSTRRRRAPPSTRPRGPGTGVRRRPPCSASTSRRARSPIVAAGCGPADGHRVPRSDPARVADGLRVTGMDAAVSALADEQGALSARLEELDDSGWAAPSRCRGGACRTSSCTWRRRTRWRWPASTARWTSSSAGWRPRCRRPPMSMPGRRRWSRSSAAPRRPTCRPAGRRVRPRCGSGSPPWTWAPAVTWVAGQLSARTLATTRLAETWIHAGDIAAASGPLPAPTDRLWHVSRLAWRTVPYAFVRAGRPAPGPVVFDLVGPSGDAWRFAPEAPRRRSRAGDDGDRRRPRPLPGGGPAGGRCRHRSRRRGPRRVRTSWPWCARSPDVTARSWTPAPRARCRDRARRHGCPRGA